MQEEEKRRKQLFKVVENYGNWILFPKWSRISLYFAHTKIHSIFKSTSIFT